MQAASKRILTTHTGSLHRPPDFEEMFRQKVSGEHYDENKFAARLRTSVAEIVRKQVEIGIDIIDDGEFSKIDFFSYARYRLDGIRPVVTATAGDSRTANAYLNPLAKSVMSSPAVRQRFAQFYADTEPPTGAFRPAALFNYICRSGPPLKNPQPTLSPDRSNTSQRKSDATSTI
jgi:methionine synthase II (cobalamin-independent)